MLLLFRFDGGVEQIDRKSLFINPRENDEGSESRVSGRVASVTSGNLVRTTLTIFHGF